jgi:hypothetical protein
MRRGMPATAWGRKGGGAGGGRRSDRWAPLVGDRVRERGRGALSWAARVPDGPEESGQRGRKGEKRGGGLGRRWGRVR